MVTQPGVAADSSPDCTDPDVGDTLTVAISTQPTNGTAAVVGGQLEYTPDPGFVGVDSFQYTANDGTTDSAPATVTMLADTAPTCADMQGTVQSGKSLVIPLASIPCDDVDPAATLEIFPDQWPQHGTLGFGPGDAVTYTPAAGFVGTATITVTPAPKAPAPTPTPNPTAPRDTTPPTVAVAHATQKLRNARAKGVALTETSSEAGTLSVAISVDRRTARRLKIKRKASGPVVIGRLAAAIGAGETTVHVRLSARARKALKHARKVKLLITVIVADAAGNKTTKTLHVTLRR